jgi:hypothetical protein
MKLQEKFYKAIYMFSTKSNAKIELCEQITEEFAIGFLNWYKIHGKWITKHLEDFELLDLYKKEKGL